jgi:hypothetical protein
MRVVVMQPYFFPYLGYFQLFQACDLFVVYDDVQYIKNGWINRNRILINGLPAYVTLPVLREPFRLKINQRQYQIDSRILEKFLCKIEGAYRKAPHYDAVMPIIQSIMAYPDSNVAAFNTNLLKRLAAHLGFPVPIVEASKLDMEPNLSGEHRVIAVCRAVDASSYINPIGGIKLYSAEAFAHTGLGLTFLCPRPSEYKQFSEHHVRNLSIIDVLMFNTLDQTRKLLTEYCLLHPSFN